MFTPASARAASTYRQVGIESGVEGASAHKLISMIFDSLLQSLAAARGAIARGDVEAKGKHLGKAVLLIEEGLKGGLNDAQGGDVAKNLRTLYSYCVQRLTLANLRTNDEMVAEVIALVTPVADGWNQMGAGSRAQGM